MLYVEELIGPNTINTVPPATLEAFRDHGKLRDSLEENIEDAKRVLAELEKSGISLDAVTADLVREGVKLFADAADKLYGAVAHKRATVLGTGLDRQALALGDAIGKAMERAVEDWRASAKIRRLWQHDKSVWTGTDEDNWLGWLNSAASADIPTTRILPGASKVRTSPTRSCSAWEDRAWGPKCLRRSLRRNLVSRNCTCLIRPIRHRFASCRARSTLPKRYSSSPASPAAQPNQT